MLVTLESGLLCFNICDRSGVPPGMNCRLLGWAGNASEPSQITGRDAEPFRARPSSGSVCRCMGSEDEDSRIRGCPCRPQSDSSSGPVCRCMGREDEGLRISGCPCTPQSGCSSALQESNSMSTAPAGQNARDEACADRRHSLSIYGVVLTAASAAYRHHRAMSDMSLREHKDAAFAHCVMQPLCHATMRITFREEGHAQHDDSCGKHVPLWALRVLQGQNWNLAEQSSAAGKPHAAAKARA